MEIDVRQLSSSINMTLFIYICSQRLTRDFDNIFLLPGYHFRVMPRATIHHQSTCLQKKRYMLFRINLTLSCWNWIYSAFANSVDPYQLASEEANWSGSVLFAIRYESISAIWIKGSDWLTIRSGHDILNFSAWQGLIRPFGHILAAKAQISLWICAVWLYHFQFVFCFCSIQWFFY